MSPQAPTSPVDDPEFVEWCHKVGVSTAPDEWDFLDVTASTITVDAMGESYRIARERKVRRLYQMWKASLTHLRARAHVAEVLGQRELKRSAP
jgi:hypothetical protein